MAHRILHIIPTLVRGGAEKQLVLLATGLPRDRYDVHVCALTYGGPLAEPLRGHEIPLAIIGKRWKADPLAFWRLKSHVARLQPQLVHTWLFAAGAYGRAAARLCGSAKLVHGERCVDKWKSSWQWSIDRRLARHTSRIIANSQEVRNHCVAHGTPASRCDVIPNGTPEPRPSDVTRDQLLDELNIPRDARLIGAIGRLWPQKRVKDLIWAIELACVLHPTVRLLIIGDGPQRAQLERFARLVSDQDRVRFLGERGDVWRILPHLDLLWQGSEYEGLPNAVMEAMAASVPVVATDIPSHRELIVNDESGYLIPIASRAGYAGATDQILGDPQRAQRLASNARQRVLHAYPVARMVERYDALYRELLQA